MKIGPYGLVLLEESDRSPDGTFSGLLNLVAENIRATIPDVVAQDPGIAAAAAALAQQDTGLLRGVPIDGAVWEIAGEPGETPFFRVTEKNGVETKITPPRQSLPLDSIVSLADLPEESSWDLVIVGTNGRAVWGRRKDGTEWPGSGLVPDAPVAFDAAGDSTTQGAGASDEETLPDADKWTTQLSGMIGYPVANWGASGARAEEITARIGGIAPTATVAGGVIPASGTVSLEDMSITPMRAGAVTQYAAELVLASGVRVAGTLKKGAPHTFTRLDSGAAITVAGRVQVVSLFGKEIRARRLILGMGINNEPLIVAGTQTIADVKRWYAAATTGLAHRPLVWGVLDRGPSEAAGTVIGDFIRALEQWLAEKYGADYLPVRQYLASDRALVDAQLRQSGFTPTDADRAAIAAGTVPPSFRVTSGSVHLNALGHWLMARLIANFITTRGLV